MATQSTLDSKVGAPIDKLEPDADQDLKKGIPGTNKTLSHARDFDEGAPPGIADTAAAPDSIESLTAGTGAQEHGNAGFVASLEQAKEKQEESGTTTI